MDFGRLLEIVGDEPAFETSLLLAGESNPDALRQQLTRWTQAGRLFQLRRGVYALAPPFQKTRAHPFCIANLLVKSSYVSLQAALAYYGLIPEYTPTTTSVTTARPNSWDTPLGSFEYRHLQPALFYGFGQVEVSRGQFAFVAAPEKALLDLAYLTPRADTPSYVAELRLQNLEQLRPDKLFALAARSGQPKLERAAQLFARRAELEAVEFERL